MSKLIPSTTCWPLGAITVRSRTSNVVSCGVAGALSRVRLTARPTIMEASSVVEAAGSARADHLAAADHGDGVGDGLDLAQLVRDEDDGGAAGLELAHDVQQLVGFLRGQHGGGLVEDEDLGVADQRLDDLHPLLDAHGQVLDQGVGIDVEAVLVGDLPDLLRGCRRG